MGQEAGMGLGNEETGWPSSCLSCHPTPWSPREDTSQKQLLGPPLPPPPSPLSSPGTNVTKPPTAEEATFGQRGDPTSINWSWKRSGPPPGLGPVCGCHQAPQAPAVLLKSEWSGDKTSRGQGPRQPTASYAEGPARSYSEMARGVMFLPC